MKVFSVILSAFLFLVVISLAEAEYSKQEAKRLLNSVDNPLFRGKTNKKVIKQAIKEIRKKFNKCRPNVCFALDGSGSINDKEFEFQKGFVLLSTAVLGGLLNPKGDFAAVQYAVLIDEISGLTNDLLPPPGFLGKVNKVKQQGSTRTFVAPGLQYCVEEFKRSPQAINKIVLLGDGKTNFGDNTPFGAQRVAKKFLDASPTNAICAGLVGNGNFDFFQELVGGNADLVLRTDKWENIITILIDIVTQVCA